MKAAAFPEDGSRCWWNVSAQGSSPAIGCAPEPPGAVFYSVPAMWLSGSAPATVPSGRASTAPPISAADAPAALAAVPDAVLAATWLAPLAVTVPGVAMTSVAHCSRVEDSRLGSLAGSHMPMGTDVTSRGVLHPKKDHSITEGVYSFQLGDGFHAQDHFTLTISNYSSAVSSSAPGYCRYKGCFLTFGWGQHQVRSSKGWVLVLVATSHSKACQQSFEFSVDKRTVTACCPGCQNQLQIKFLGMLPAASQMWVPAEDKGYAYVTILWPPDHNDRSGCSDQKAKIANKKRNVRGMQKLMCDALMLGYSLRQHCVCQTRILLFVGNIQDWCGHELLSKFWQIRHIEHAMVHEDSLAKCESRFRKVFTKLRAWELTEFRQVVLMDVDTVVKENVDCLFSLATPSACWRGNFSAPDGSRRPHETLFDSNGARIGGINAGVIVLTPDKQDFRLMMEKVTSGNVRQTTCPEQDFLTDFFLGRIDSWNRLGVAYNFQPHQLQYLHRHQSLEHSERRMDFEKIKILHFSGDYSPRDFLFVDDLSSPTNFGTWFETHLLGRYGAREAKDRETVRQCCSFWYDVWANGLVRQVLGSPELRALVKCSFWAGLFHIQTKSLLECLYCDPLRSVVCEKYGQAQLQVKSTQQGNVWERSRYPKGCCLEVPAATMGKTVRRASERQG